MATYTMIFAMPEYKEDFVAHAPFMKGGIKVVAELDRRTINVRFRKGTKAQRRKESLILRTFGMLILLV